MVQIAKISQLPIVTELHVRELPEGQVTQLRVQMIGNGLGMIVHLPVIVIRGVRPGPTLGITAATHGNELNGMHTIHQLVEGLDPGSLAGTGVAVPVVNVLGYLANERGFHEGQDLNRAMPGKAKGTTTQVYAHRFMTRVAKEFEYLVDLHTASTGRINSLYVRADMTDPISATMALAQSPQIIVHNAGEDGTLRGAMMKSGVPAITVEVGNPQTFQASLVTKSVEGLTAILSALEMVPDEVPTEKEPPIICSRSYWLYTEAGGVLQVLPGLVERIDEGQPIARIRDVYGNMVAEYFAPEAGVVIGRSVNPVNQTGSRILHLGIVARDSDFFNTR